MYSTNHKPNPHRPDRHTAEANEPASEADRATPRAEPDSGSDAVILIKNGQRYVFRCAPGEEAALMQHVRDLAQRSDHNIGWYDAARLCHQLGQRLRMRLTTTQAMT